MFSIRNWFKDRISDPTYFAPAFFYLIDISYLDIGFLYLFWSAISVLIVDLVQVQVQEEIQYPIICSTHLYPNLRSIKYYVPNLVDITSTHLFVSCIKEP